MSEMMINGIKIVSRARDRPSKWKADDNENVFLSTFRMTLLAKKPLSSFSLTLEFYLCQVVYGKLFMTWFNQWDIYFQTRIFNTY